MEITIKGTVEEISACMEVLLKAQESLPIDIIGREETTSEIKEEEGTEINILNSSEETGTKPQAFPKFFFKGHGIFGMDVLNYFIKYGATNPKSLYCSHSSYIYYIDADLTISNMLYSQKEVLESDGYIAQDPDCYDKLITLTF